MYLLYNIIYYLQCRTTIYYQSYYQPITNNDI